MSVVQLRGGPCDGCKGVTGGPPRIARPARYLVLLAADNTLTIKKTNRDPVESTQVQRGEMPEEALLRLGYTRATRGKHAQPMPWSPQPDGSLWTTAVRTERQP